MVHSRRSFAMQGPGGLRETINTMPDRVLKPHAENDDLPPPPTDEFFEEMGKAGVFLPAATEVARLSEESRIVVHTHPRSAGADRYRLVLLRLKALQAAKNLKSILITSPQPQDGKSTAALNIATGLAEKGKRSVLLVEADVHRPVLAQRLGLKSWPGLTECFRTKSDPLLAVRRIDPLGFYYLPAGRPLDDDSNLFQPEFISQLMKGVAASFWNWIVIDAPPSTPIADILVLRAHADATLLVARAGQTPREAIEETARNVGRENILGIVLNGVEGLDRVYSSYYSYGNSGKARRKPEKSHTIASLGLNTHEK